MKKKWLPEMVTHAPMPECILLDPTARHVRSMLRCIRRLFDPTLYHLPVPLSPMPDTVMRYEGTNMEVRHDRVINGWILYRRPCSSDKGDNAADCLPILPVLGKFWKGREPIAYPCTNNTTNAPTMVEILAFPPLRAFQQALQQSGAVTSNRATAPDTGKRPNQILCVIWFCS